MPSAAIADSPATAPGNVPRLELDRVRRVFADRVAVDGISLSLAPGEILALLGPSGCGKSTTLRLCAGIERPDSGTVRIDGREVAGPRCFVPPEKRSTGLIFQDFALFPHMSVADNVAFGLTGLPKRERASAVHAALSRVGLDRLSDAWPHTLSGGEQQRVALARALAPAPSVLLMDEPFSGLDTRLRDTVRDDTFQALRDTGAAALLVTHDPEEAMRLADRIALMRDGRIVQIGSPEALYGAPADLETAAFFSEVDLMDGSVSGGSVETPLGTVDARGLADGTPVNVAVRVHGLELVAPSPVLPRLRVARSRFLGADTLIELATEGAVGEAPRRFKARIAGTVAFEEGASVSVVLDPSRTFVFPA